MPTLRTEAWTGNFEHACRISIKDGLVCLISDAGTRNIFRFHDAELELICREFLGNPRPQLERFLAPPIQPSPYWMMGFWRSTEDLQLVSSALHFALELRLWAEGASDRFSSLIGRALRDLMPRPNILIVPRMQGRLSGEIVRDTQTALGEHLFQMCMLYRLKLNQNGGESMCYFRPYNTTIVRSSQTQALGPAWDDLRAEYEQIVGSV